MDSDAGHVETPSVSGASGTSGASVGIGVIGARSMVARLAVLPAITKSKRAHLAAAASLGGPVPDPWSDTSVADYQTVIDHPDVDAVYIPLPNGMHEEWVARTAAAGKAVLVEKPIAPTVAAARRMQQVCADANVLLAEAFMTPFDARWAEALRLAATGLVGPISEIHSAFTFTIGPDAADNYRWDPGQGGGALLDVGIYCLSPAVMLWGHGPPSISATQSTAPDRTGPPVDATTSAELRWGENRSATIRCSFVEDERQRLELVGSDGSLVLDGDAHTGGERASSIELRSSDGISSKIGVTPSDPYLGMIDAFADAVSGIGPWPRPIEDSIDMLGIIERIQEAAA